MRSNRKRTIDPQDDELDSAACGGEPPIDGRSLKRTDYAEVVAKGMVGCMPWLEVERLEGKATEVGRPGHRGDGAQESEPSYYCTALAARAMESIGWHRRETRRQTENTNRFLRFGGRQGRKSAESKPVPREGGQEGRYEEVQTDAENGYRRLHSAGNR